MINASSAPDRRPSTSILLGRGAGFLGVWLVLIGAAPADLPFGLIAAIAATWTSLKLWPPDGTLSAVGTVRFVARFLPQSVIAGVDVARRALARTVALQPGFVSYAPALPPGPARRALCAVMSLQPGKLPATVSDNGELQVHCLDVSEPVAEQIVSDEAAFQRMLPGGHGIG